MPPPGTEFTGFTTACGGILICVPGYGNCCGVTHALYARRVVSEMLNLSATARGESPATTVYKVSSPTAPEGNVVVVPGAVLATGGIVAKLVGVTFTTVVATPNVSPPQAAPKTDAPRKHAEMATKRPALTFGRILNTETNSRACETVNGGASDRHTNGRAVGGMGAGREVSPMRYVSTPAAQARPSAIAHTIRL